MPEPKDSGMPALPTVAAAAAGSSWRPLTLFLGWNLQVILNLLLSLPCCKLKMIVKCNTSILRQFYSWNLLACSQALWEMAACLDGIFLAWSTWALLKGQWHGSERIMLGRLVDFEVRVIHMPSRHINIMCKMFPPKRENKRPGFWS